MPIEPAPHTRFRRALGHCNLHVNERLTITGYELFERVHENYRVNFNMQEHCTPQSQHENIKFQQEIAPGQAMICSFART